MVYGQLVLLQTRTESTRTFSLVNSYFFATRTLVNSYFFFGQLVLFFGQLVLFCNSYFGQLVLFLWSTRTFLWSTRTFSLVNSYFLKKITYDMLCYFIMALLVP